MDRRKFLKSLGIVTGAVVAAKVVAAKVAPKTEPKVVNSPHVVLKAKDYAPNSSGEVDVKWSTDDSGELFPPAANRPANIYQKSTGKWIRIDKHLWVPVWE